MEQLLQIVNIALTSGVLVLLVGAAVAYGKLTQKVEGHDKSIQDIWERHNRLNDIVIGRGDER